MMHFCHETGYISSTSGAKMAAVPQPGMLYRPCELWSEGLCRLCQPKRRYFHVHSLQW